MAGLSCSEKCKWYSWGASSDSVSSTCQSGTDWCTSVLHLFWHHRFRSQATTADIFTMQTIHIINWLQAFLGAVPYLRHLHKALQTSWCRPWQWPWPGRLTSKVFFLLSQNFGVRLEKEPIKKDCKNQDTGLTLSIRLCPYSPSQINHRSWPQKRRFRARSFHVGGLSFLQIETLETSRSSTHHVHISVKWQASYLELLTCRWSLFGGCPLTSVNFAVESFPSKYCHLIQI